jgi:uncharacterized protein YjiS (DUF1127 family)
MKTTPRSFAALPAALLQWFTARGRSSQSLHDVDARTLADIGVDPSELASIEAESRGRSAITRRRIVAAPVAL